METFGKRNLILLFVLSVLSFAVMGYHPGAEDDTVYVTAVKADLNPALYPHDSEFFKLQVKTSVFDNWMADFVRATHISVAWSELLWQFLSVYFILLGGWAIICRLFTEPSARWGAVALLGAMLTLPVAGTGLYLVDQYLHPRNPATALILFALDRILAGRRWQALPLLILAFILHPLMGAFGVSFAAFLAVVTCDPVHEFLSGWLLRPLPHASLPAAALIPFGWVLGTPSQAWMDSMRPRHLFWLYHWEWYEWLGAIAPLFLFWLLARYAASRGENTLAKLATALFLYGAFQQCIALVILSPWAPIGLTTLEPMRYLHVIYIFLVLIAGAYLGKHLLKRHAWRWAVLLAVANGGMFFAQRQLFAASPAVEFPGQRTANPWLQAFRWIRHNTPQNAYFAIDPHYESDPGEDWHSFRALAERSVLADAYKDGATVTKMPSIANIWETQVRAQDGWNHFQLADFERLKTQFGVNWVMVSYPHPPAGLNCLWHNASLTVCRVP
ncbi:MAG TPA: DUF6798 domain-containing protein [Terracidiphilus sp.]|nr:DUF6798 domain-containing protein [Terracidiphilus sp.]